MDLVVSGVVEGRGEELTGEERGWNGGSPWWAGRGMPEPIFDTCGFVTFFEAEWPRFLASLSMDVGRDAFCDLSASLAA